MATKRKQPFLINSDSTDTEDEPPKREKRNCRKNQRVLNTLLLTSDSDTDESLKKNKNKKPNDETFLGEIDLITSDEDELASSSKTSKPIRKKQKKIKTIDLMTSDEDDPFVPSKSNQTRDEAKQTQSKIKTLENSPKKRKVPANASNSTNNAKKPKINHHREETIENKNTLKKDDNDPNPTWKEQDLLASKTAVDPGVANTIIKLFKEGNTIPFIARYRRNVTGNLGPEALRDIKKSYEDICQLKGKIATVINTIEKVGKLDYQLKRSIRAATTLEELEHIYAPFKPDAKKSLVQKAKELGLEEPARCILENVKTVNLNAYVDSNTKGIENTKKVQEGIMHIIATLISSDSNLLAFLRDVKSQINFTLETRRISIAKKGKTETKTKKSNLVDESKFEHYYNFKMNVHWIKPHQVLAINRGEAQKCLSVKIIIPSVLENKFKNFCYDNWINKSMYDKVRKDILLAAVNDAYTRIIQPLITREIRAELKQKAETSSVEIFSENLKQILMATPLKGKHILGIDPGFKNGCKIALISPTGSLLDHCVIYPHYNKSSRGEEKLKILLNKHRCELIALGSGTACRETESWIADLIEYNYFAPLNVTYTIVNEDGASIYSCSPEAKKEFKDLDPNIISAVSIARRVQDPMAELVKIEPAHLGVGMYQLDIKKKQLSEALDEVVSECVSFVGVDLNTASQCLLRRVAGLSDKRATLIIDHRNKIGAFSSRKQLLEVYSIGQRIFEQCAGFLRVSPASSKEASSFYRNKDATKLDATIIHPESYKTALGLIKMFSLQACDIGTDDFINIFKEHATRLDITNLSTQLKSSTDTIQLIIDALTKKLDYDLRSDLGSGPIFKAGCIDAASIKEGDILTGRVKNVTSFGAFVDIGIGSDSLVHCTQYNGLKLNIGNKVEVQVINIKEDAKGRIRIQLKAERLI